MSLAYTDLLKAKKYFPTNLSCLKTNFSLLSREFEKHEHFKQHFHVILLKHTCRSIFVLLIVWFKSGLVETHYHQKELLRKSRASVVVIGDSVLAGLRVYLTVWRNFILWYKTIKLGIGGDQIKNILWHINNIVLLKSIRSIVIHCGTNNIDTSSSDEISMGVVTIARSIFHRYPNIEIIVSGLLPRDIHWSTRRVKINETNDYLRDYCKKIKKNDFHAPRPRLDFARQFSKHETLL